MFRLASIVLLAASLSSVAVAQDADKAVQKSPTNQDAVNTQSKNDTVNADGVAADAQPKPLPFAGCAYLELSVDKKLLHAFVHGAEPGFVGVVGLSLTPDLAQSFGMPPLLVDAVVVAYGVTKSQDLELSVPFLSMPTEAILIYGQAVVLDEHGIWASGIVPLQIGQAKGNKPANGSQMNADQALQPAAH